MTDPGYEYTRAFSSGEITRGRSKTRRVVKLSATGTAIAAGLLAFVIVWLCISLAILAGT